MPTRPSSRPDQHHRHRLLRRTVRQHHRTCEAEHHQAEIFGGVELEREPAHRRAGGGDHDSRDVPAMNDAIAAIASAGPARPCFAIWWPSMQVTIAEDSPGTLTRIAVVEPPYCAP